jgi:gas vesicle protein
MKEVTSHNTAIIVAFITGALAGAALGIMLSPDKGTVTRSKFIAGAKELAKGVKEKLKEEARSLSNKTSDIEKLAKAKMENINESINA